MIPHTETHGTPQIEVLEVISLKPRLGIGVECFPHEEIILDSTEGVPCGDFVIGLPVGIPPPQGEAVPFGFGFEVGRSVGRCLISIAVRQRTRAGEGSLIGD